jgi:hypothetical protein
VELWAINGREILPSGDFHVTFGFFYMPLSTTWDRRRKKQLLNNIWSLPYVEELMGFVHSNNCKNIKFLNVSKNITLNLMTGAFVGYSCRNEVGVAVIYFHISKSFIYQLMHNRVALKEY